MVENILKNRIQSLEQKLIQKGREIVLLREMSLYLTDSVPKTLDLVAYRIGVLTNAKFVRLYLINQAHTKLVFVSGYNLSDKYLEMVTNRLEVSIDAVPCGRAIIDRIPYVVSNVNSDEAFSAWRDVTAMHGYASYIAMPLFVADRILGAVDIFFGDVKYFSDDEINLLTVLSNTGALAIENALLLETIEHISIVDEDTGAFNRKHFIQTLRTEAERAKKNKEPLALIIIRMIESPAENNAMKLFVSDMKGGLKGSDMIFRYGDSSFCVILTGPLANSYADTVLSGISESFHRIFGKEAAMKMGVSTMPDDGIDAEMLLKNALESIG